MFRNSIQLQFRQTEVLLQNNFSSVLFVLICVLFKTNVPIFHEPIHIYRKPRPNLTYIYMYIKELIHKTLRTLYIK